MAGRGAALSREQVLREAAVSAQRLSGLLHTSFSGLTWSSTELISEGDRLRLLLSLLRESGDVGRAA